MAATGLYVENVRVHVQHLVQEYKETFTMNSTQPVQFQQKTN